MRKIDRVKKRIYEIVEVSREKEHASRSYDFMMLTAVVVGLIPLTMKTENQYCKVIDLVTVIIFLLDYIFRIFTSDYKMGIKSYKAYLAYAFTPFAIIDLLSVVPILMFFFPGNSVIRMFRLFRVFVVFKLLRYSKVMVQISNVLRRIKRQLLAVLVLTLIYIASSALIIFQVEPDMFENFFEAIYWSTITITTVGYGDVYPSTTIGQVLTSISSLVGVAIIALPSGIITAAYMEEINKKKSKLEL